MDSVSFLVQGWFKLKNEIVKCGVANINDCIICYFCSWEWHYSDVKPLTSYTYFYLFCFSKLLLVISYWFFCVCLVLHRMSSCEISCRVTGRVPLKTGHSHWCVDKILWRFPTCIFVQNLAKLLRYGLCSHIYFKSNLHLVSVTKVAFMAMGGQNFISKLWNNNLTSLVPKVLPLGYSVGGDSLAPFTIRGWCP